MDFNTLLQVVGEEPIFETGMLLAGDVEPADVQRQLSRWVASGRIYQLRRGVYALAPPFRKVQPHPFLVANRLVRASYVSCQSALAHYNLIPEFVPVTTSITTQRPGEFNTCLGRYRYQHVKMKQFYGYRFAEVGIGQFAFIATPEKALLDLIYLEPGGAARAYLDELRLQNLGQLDQTVLQKFAQQSASPKLQRAVAQLVELAQTEAAAFEPL